MNREDIFCMAREAGFDPHDMSADFTCNLRDIERFAALVAEHERNRLWTQAPWTEYKRTIAAAEREMCAKVCEDRDLGHGNREDAEARRCAKAIRARGQA